MLTVKEFAAKIGADKSSVLRWIAEGRIPGAKLEKLTRGKMVYVIPDDAVRPETRYYHGGASTVQTKRFKADTSVVIDQEHKKQLDFVNQHISWSVRSIAHNLGVSTNRVRELFDELLHLGGAEDEFETFV